MEKFRRTYRQRFTKSQWNIAWRSIRVMRHTEIMTQIVAEADGDGTPQELKALAYFEYTYQESNERHQHMYFSKQATQAYNNRYLSYDKYEQKNWAFKHGYRVMMAFRTYHARGN